MFLTILFVVTSSLLVVSPTGSEAKRPPRAGVPRIATRVRREEVPVVRADVARRCDARTAAQHELAGHESCRCTRRPLPCAEARVLARMRRNPRFTEANKAVSAAVHTSLRCPQAALLRGSFHCGRTKWQV